MSGQGQILYIRVRFLLIHSQSKRQKSLNQKKAKHIFFWLKHRTKAWAIKLARFAPGI